jgi:hypothetical protein
MVRVFTGRCPEEDDEIDREKDYEIFQVHIII